MTRAVPYDPDALWAKSRLFINRAMDESTEFEEAAFWACCSLELLGKCALAHISPLLIAIPTDDGMSLMVASGAVEDPDSFISVQAKTVWARCARAFRQFNAAEARELSLGRNAYIHSGAIGFDLLPPEQWWPRFWAQANVLIAHCGQDLDSFVGPARARIADTHLQTNRANLDRRLQSLLENARLRLRLHQNNSMGGRMLREWDQYKSVIYWDHIAYVNCPACEGAATIGGDEILERNVEDIYSHDPDDWRDAHVTLTIATDGLQCDDCHLELPGPDLIDAAGVDPTFEAEGGIDDIAHLYEEEYNNE